MGWLGQSATNPRGPQKAQGAQHLAAERSPLSPPTASINRFRLKVVGLAHLAGRFSGCGPAPRRWAMEASEAKGSENLGMRLGKSKKTHAGRLVVLHFWRGGRPCVLFFKRRGGWGGGGSRYF